MNIVAIIPAFNEEKTIGRVIDSVMPHVSHVVVVDDGSHDATNDIAQQHGAIVVTHTINKGVDATLNDGFAKAATLGADIMFTFDADGEHDAGDIERLLKPIIEGVSDISLGCRPTTRHWSETIFAFCTRIRYGIIDPLCGLKAYKREVYQNVGFFDSVSSIGSELAIRAVKQGYRASYMPITLHAREEGDSSRFYAFSWRGNMKVIKALYRTMRI